MTSFSVTSVNTTALLRRLTDLIGADSVSVDLQERRLLSSDLFYEGQAATCFIKPADQQSLCAALALNSAEGVANVRRCSFADRSQISLHGDTGAHDGRAAQGIEGAP